MICFPLSQDAQSLGLGQPALTVRITDWHSKHTLAMDGKPFCSLQTPFLFFLWKGITRHIKAYCWEKAVRHKSTLHAVPKHGSRQESGCRGEEQLVTALHGAGHESVLNWWGVTKPYKHMAFYMYSIYPKKKKDKIKKARAWSRPVAPAPHTPMFS